MLQLLTTLNISSSISEEIIITMKKILIFVLPFLFCRKLKTCKNNFFSIVGVGLSVCDVRIGFRISFFTN